MIDKFKKRNMWVEREFYKRTINRKLSNTQKARLKKVLRARAIRRYP